MTNRRRRGVADADKGRVYYKPALEFPHVEVTIGPRGPQFLELAGLDCKLGARSASGGPFVSAAKRIVETTLDAAQLY
jgi:hypothetical protein